MGAVGVASLALAVVGAATSAYGAEQQGQAAKKAADYQAQVAANNATIATNNANRAAAAGEQQAAMAGAKTRATVGAIEAGQAASGVDVGTGSALDVQQSQKENGMQDALTIRSNAAEQAYGYMSQSASFTAQSQLDTMSGENAAEAGNIGAASTGLTGLANAGMSWAKFDQAQGLVPTAGSSTGAGVADSTPAYTATTATV